MSSFRFRAPLIFIHPRSRALRAARIIGQVDAVPSDSGRLMRLRRRRGAPEDRPPAAPPQTRSGDETKAAMDRVNSDRSAFYQHLGPATHSEPWRDYVGADGYISMRPRGGWGFP